MDQLTFVGHATTAVRLGETEVLTDPVTRDRIGPLRRHSPAPAEGTLEAADAVLISHLHRDHLDLPTLRRLPAGTRLIVPRGAGATVAKSGAREVIEVEAGDRTAVGGVNVTAVPALHDRHRDPRWGPTAEPVGYLLESHGMRVYFAGDTERFPGMADLAPLDLALLPVWGWGPTLGDGHLDPEEAARCLVDLRPSVAVPIHWGTFYPLGLRRLHPGPLSDPPRRFAEIAARVAPDVAVRLLEPGETLPLRAADSHGRAA